MDIQGKKRERKGNVNKRTDKWKGNSDDPKERKRKEEEEMRFSEEDERQGKGKVD